MKKMLAVLLCLLLLNGWASAAMCVRMDGGALLLGADGSEIIPLGVYEDIVPLGGNLYAACRDGAYALMDDTGELRSDFSYDYLALSGDVLIAETGGLRGLISPDGEPISPLEYTRILPAGDGSFRAIRGDGDDLESDELFILDANGNESATGLFIRRMHEAGEADLLAVLEPGSGLWGYCGVSGEMVIPARYSHAGAFLHGRAAVVEEGLYGVIDTGGKTIIEAAYDYLEVCAGGFILAGLSQQGVWVFDLNGNEIARYEGEETAAAPVGDGYAVYDGESLILYAADGEILAQGVQGASITEGLAGQFILANGAWGEQCVGIVGTENLYQNLYPLGYAQGEPVYACMEANSARYINDLLGEVQISVDIESARYGVVDAQGELIIPAEFESIAAIADDRLLCHMDDYWQVMDTAGNIYWNHGVRQIEEPIA
ncbi:MAG: WG repeat-containing protein [Clostridia bacterium]|nr:WG repeat-containing protein [Clostridia bacterium]